MNILAAPCDAGRLAALLAGAEARGIKVLLPRNDSDAYIVSHGVYVRAVESLDELAALLAKMGVVIDAAPVAAYSVSKPG